MKQPKRSITYMTGDCVKGVVCWYERRDRDFPSGALEDIRAEGKTEQEAAANLRAIWAQKKDVK